MEEGDLVGAHVVTYVIGLSGLRGYEILEKNTVLRMDPWLPKKHVSRSQI